MKPGASQFVDRYDRRVLTNTGAPGMDGNEGLGSTIERMKCNVAAAIFANCSQLDNVQLDEIIKRINLYRS